MNTNEEWTKAMSAHGFITRDTNGNWVKTDKLTNSPLYQQLSDAPKASTDAQNDFDAKLRELNALEFYKKLRDADMIPAEDIKEQDERQDAQNDLMDIAERRLPDYRNLYMG